MKQEEILSTFKELGFRVNEAIAMLEQNKIIYAYEYLKKISKYIDERIKSIEK